MASICSDFFPIPIYHKKNLHYADKMLDNFTKCQKLPIAHENIKY